MNSVQKKNKPRHHFYTGSICTSVLTKPCYKARWISIYHKCTKAFSKGRVNSTEDSLVVWQVAGVLSVNREEWKPPHFPTSDFELERSSTIWLRVCACVCVLVEARRHYMWGTSCRTYIQTLAIEVPQTMTDKSRQRLQIPIDLLRDCVCLGALTTGYYWETAGPTFKETARVRMWLISLSPTHA